ncbi:hypothetical protein MYAER_3854 [Microcystis aeruginosa NIES-2549]|uniref:Uncharacterized protein n=1 Tax=Microcystis aeruginosa NIES-2549 TaxID=1641812 RepID=A0A0F6U7F3_MICAE|nr:hypothetical protein MYAER_3854 [Microcystis aeruginosa NIES-2549]AOC54594.1 hypothetical protein amyaer_3901 [Microcystis aeruginosa NIES-2481]
MVSADKSERDPAKTVAGKLLLTFAKIINLGEKETIWCFFRDVC